MAVYRRCKGGTVKKGLNVEESRDLRREVMKMMKEE